MIKLKQLLCRHKNIGYYTKISKYHNLQGETVYRICNDCGKIISSEFYNNEEFCSRFRFN